MKARWFWSKLARVSAEYVNAAFVLFIKIQIQDKYVAMKSSK